MSEIGAPPPLTFEQNVRQAAAWWAANPERAAEEVGEFLTRACGGNIYFERRWIKKHVLPIRESLATADPAWNPYRCEKHAWRSVTGQFRTYKCLNCGHVIMRD